MFPSGNVRQGQTQETGDLAAGFKAAAHTIEETYATHVITHICLESHGTVCEWDGDKLTVWMSTQGINTRSRELRHRRSSIPQANVRVITQYMGGGFGSKALSVGRRGPDLRQAGQGGRGAGQADARSQGGASRRPATGRRRPRGSRPASPPTARSPRSMPSRGAPAVPARTRASRCPTSIGSPTAAGRTRTCTSTPASSAPMRAPGHPQGWFLTEILMDELADKVSMDPVEFRIKNLPPEAPNAMWRAYLRDGATRVRLGQAAPDRRQGGRTDQDRHGRGDLHVGRRRSRTGASALRDHVRRQRRRARRHAGHRHRHAHAGRDGRCRTLGLPAVAGQARRLATRSMASARCPGAARRRRASVPAIRVAAVKALDALKEKVAPALGVDAAVAGRRGRPHSRQGRPVARAGVGRRVQADRPAADRGRRRLGAGLVVGDDERRAVRRSQRRHRDRHRPG